MADHGTGTGGDDADGGDADHGAAADGGDADRGAAADGATDGDRSTDAGARSTPTGDADAAAVGDADTDAAATGDADTDGVAVADGGEAYDVDDVDPYSGPTGTGSGPTPGAPDDEEMPLADHVEEMIGRLGWIIVVGALVSGIVFPFAEELINFLWYSFLPGSTEVCPVPITETNSAACPYVYHPLALIFARLKVASLVGFIIALPVMVYQSYLFMRPGLYPKERRYYLASVPTSLVLAAIGVSFAYFLVLPTLFAYFTTYTDQAAQVAFGLTETFNLVVMLMGFFSLIFQIPLLIMLAVMMGVTTRRWLAARRIYFYGGFATVAFLFSPDPTGMAPILVAVTMIALFEGTLLTLRWTRESSPIPSVEALAARRPTVWILALVAGYLSSPAPLPSGYHDQLPAAATDLLAAYGLTRLTPVVIGLALIAAYELVLYVLKRAAVVPRVRRTLSRGRALSYPLALLVGYFGSPDTSLIARVDAIDLAPLRVGLLVVGLVVAYELLLVALDWSRRRREA